MRAGIIALCGLMAACGADEVGRVATNLDAEDINYGARQGDRSLPEALRDEVSLRDVAAEWADTGYIYFSNPPPDSNAEQLEIEVRGHNVERYRYGLLPRDTWCTEDDLTNEAKVGETIILSPRQLRPDGIKVLCALPRKLHNHGSTARTFSMLRWKKNNQPALLLNNLPRRHERRLQVVVQNSKAEKVFDSYYYKVLNERVDCSIDQSAYHERRIDEPLDHGLTKAGWHTLCVTGDYEHIRSHQWQYQSSTEAQPARLLLSSKEITFTLGDNRQAELGVWNNGRGTLVWEAVLPSNKDRHDLSWKPRDGQPQLALQPEQLLPTYSLPWLDMRAAAHWSNVSNKDEHNPQPLTRGELARGKTQKLTFRLADADNNYASWWSGLDPHIYKPYQYTKVLRFTNLASHFSTDLAVTLYVPEMQLSHTQVTLTPDKTQQMVAVRNIGRGDLRWQMQALPPEGVSEIEAVGVAHHGKDEQGRMHGEGVVMLAIDTPLPTTRTEQVLEFSYMGGDTIQLPVVFTP